MAKIIVSNTNQETETPDNNSIGVVSSTAANDLQNDLSNYVDFFDKTKEPQKELQW